MPTRGPRSTPSWLPRPPAGGRCRWRRWRRRSTIGWIAMTPTRCAGPSWAASRHVEVIDDRDGSGMSWIEGKLFSHDAAALDERLDEMARAVCAADPRTREQRRADALGALAQGGDRLTCGCSDG